MGLGKGRRDGAGLEALERMEQMFNKIWLKAAGIRAVKTMAQTAVATIGTATMEYCLPFSRKRRILDLYCGAKWSKWERTASLVEGVSR